MRIQKKQLNEINQFLKKWREERHITLDMQKQGFKGNFYEEVSEFYRSVTKEEQIDALCDMLVFTLNTHGQYIEDTLLNSNALEEWVLDSRERTLDIIIKDLLEEQTIKLVLDLIALLDQYTKNNSFECMQEVLKEINSRTGSYSELQRKFIKDRGAYTLIEASKIRDNEYPDSLLWDDDKFYYIKEATGNVIRLSKWYKADFRKYLERENEKGST